MSSSDLWALFGFDNHVAFSVQIDGFSFSCRLFFLLASGCIGPLPSSASLLGLFMSASKGCSVFGQLGGCDASFGIFVFACHVKLLARLL